jgi:hypothetical protein
VGENLVGTSARLELLNETNRDEAQRDVLAWLKLGACVVAYVH